jgi:hypothetical protein
MKFLWEFAICSRIRVEGLSVGWGPKPAHREPKLTATRLRSILVLRQRQQPQQLSDGRSLLPQFCFGLSGIAAHVIGAIALALAKSALDQIALKNSPLRV